MRGFLKATVHKGRKRGSPNLPVDGEGRNY